MEAGGGGSSTLPASNPQFTSRLTFKSLNQERPRSGWAYISQESPLPEREPQSRAAHDRSENIWSPL